MISSGGSHVPEPKRSVSRGTLALVEQKNFIYTIPRPFKSTLLDHFTDAGSRNKNEILVACLRVNLRPEGFFQHPLNPVAGYRIPELLRYGHTQPDLFGIVISALEPVQHKMPGRLGRPFFVYPLEISTAGESSALGRTRAGARHGQTARRLRPLRRRRRITSRPPLVLIRTRKPWVLARLRFFGWYVRFIGSGSIRSRVALCLALSINTRRASSGQNFSPRFAKRPTIVNGTGCMVGRPRIQVRLIPP